MEDLDDLVLFAFVVKYGSFSGAARALGIPKSRVSRRVAALEERTGVRLLQRSTRALHITDIGSVFYEHCQVVTQAAQSAFEAAEYASERPSGRLYVSCPIGVAHIFLAPVLPKFLSMYPDVQLVLDLTDRRRVDVIAEGFDVALRVRSTLEDSDLALRVFGQSDQVLVASPSFVAKHGPFNTVESLQGVGGCGPAGIRGERNVWRVTCPDTTVVDIRYKPALVTGDVHLLEQAAMGGVGVVQIPFNLCESAIRNGSLVVLLHRHRLPVDQIHAVFPSGRGVAPVVRSFLDFLSAELRGVMADANAGFQETVLSAVI